MPYLEDLPPDCPPANKASEISVEAAYRVVSCMTPTVTDFYSNSALGIPKPPTVDACRYASCSLFMSRDKALEIASKLPKMRIAQPHLSLCNIEPFHGKSYINKKKHVDFWPYDTFDPEAAVVSTEKV